MQLVHDRMGYLSHAKMLWIIQRKFMWPVMCKDVLRYCQSCLALTNNELSNILFSQLLPVL